MATESNVRTKETKMWKDTSDISVGDEVFVTRRYGRPPLYAAVARVTGTTFEVQDPDFGVTRFSKRTGREYGDPTGLCAVVHDEADKALVAATLPYKKQRAQLEADMNTVVALVSRVKGEDLAKALALIDGPLTKIHALVNGVS